MSDDGEEIKWWALWSADSYGNLFVAEAGLTFDESIMFRDSQNGGRGIAAPDRYATRCMGVLSAARIGDRILDEKIAEAYRSLTFGETEVVGETPTYWSFGRSREEWVAEVTRGKNSSCSNSDRTGESTVLRTLNSRLAGDLFLRV